MRPNRRMGHYLTPIIRDMQEVSHYFYILLKLKFSSTYAGSILEYKFDNIVRTKLLIIIVVT